MTPKYKSYQEAFDATVEHLAKQKRAARRSDKSGCFYHMTDGRMCAVGCHIPKNHPAQATLGPVGMLVGHYPDIKQLLSIESAYNNDFWYALQGAHDNSITLDELVSDLIKIVDTHKLSPDKITMITEWSPS